MPIPNRKGGRKRHTPPARFVGTIRIPVGSEFVKCHSLFHFINCMTCFHLPLRPTRLGESRKRSVPLRVHSHSKSFGSSSPVARLTASNPFLTHGTVESPAKLFSPAVPLC